MASAVLASNNESHWKDKAYIRNAVNNAVNRSRYNPIPNPNPSPNFQIPQIENPSPPATWHQDNDPPTVTHPPPPPAAASGCEDLVTINLGEYSRAELRELERRLRAELDQVRQVRERIDTLNAVVEPPPQLLSPKILSPPPPKKGTKRGLLSGPDREPKRLAALNSPKLESILKKMMTRCSQILAKLMKHKHGWVFNKPVDAVALGLHDYFQIIKRPMDLGTVKSKLSKKEYKNPIDFASDVRLVFKNAMTYNPKGQDAHVMADNLLGVFEKMFNPSYEKFEADKGRLLGALGIKKRVTDKIGEENVQILLPDYQLDKKLMPKLAKPKENLNKRVMSFEEKTKLGVSLQELPPENMGAMLVILSKRNSGMEQEGDEIELDFETLDNETLWELDMFVNNLKKDTKKQSSAEKSPVREQMLEVVPMKSAKVDIMEEDVDIGEDIPINNYPPLEIEKDESGSSSSSGDSSSSSGSGSVTSSGSDSDEDSVQSPFIDPK